MSDLLLVILLEADYQSQDCEANGVDRMDHLFFLRTVYQARESSQLLHWMMLENQWTWETTGTDIGFGQWLSDLRDE